MVVLALKCGQFNTEVIADLLHHFFENIQRLTGKDLFAVFGHKDQVRVNGKYTVPTCSNKKPASGYWSVSAGFAPATTWTSSPVVRQKKACRCILRPCKPLEPNTAPGANNSRKPNCAGVCRTARAARWAGFRSRPVLCHTAQARFTTKARHCPFGSATGCRAMRCARAISAKTAGAAGISMSRWT